MEEIHEEADFTEFYDRHIADISVQLSLVVSDIVRENDQTPFSTSKLTRFHSRAPPGISIKDYLLRIIKFCNLDKAVLLVVPYLIDLFSESYKKFVLNSLTVHRFIITACTIAAKGLCDQFCSNTHYAKVGGLSLMELNLLEVEFLTRVRYRIVPPTTALIKYDRLLKSKHVDSIRSRNTPQEGQPNVQPNGQPNVQPNSQPNGQPNGQSAIQATGQQPPINVAQQQHQSQLPHQLTHNAQGQPLPYTSSQPQPQQLHTQPISQSSGRKVENGLDSRKHPREEINHQSVPTKSNDDEHYPHDEGQPKPPGKPTGNKGFKAMKDTFKFLQTSKKK